MAGKGSQGYNRNNDSVHFDSLFYFAPQSETVGGENRSTNVRKKRPRPEDAVQAPPLPCENYFPRSTISSRTER